MSVNTLSNYAESKSKVIDGAKNKSPYPPCLDLPSLCFNGRASHTNRR